MHDDGDETPAIREARGPHHWRRGGFSGAVITEIFHMLDTNGDGRVTREEYSANKVEIIYRNMPTATTNLRFEHTKLSRAFFDAADADHDGTLSPVRFLNRIGR